MNLIKENGFENKRQTINLPYKGTANSNLRLAFLLSSDVNGQ
jgi:hypothetical protein